MAAFASAGVKLDKVSIAMAPAMIGAAFATDGIVCVSTCIRRNPHHNVFPGMSLRDRSWWQFEMWPATTELSSKYNFRYT